MNHAPWAALAFGLALSACGAGAPQASPAAAALEIDHLTAATAGVGLSAVPLFIAQDEGFFKAHGLTVDVSQIAPPAANQAMVSGSLDVFHGSASVITAHLAGTDSIYMAAPTDHSPNVLYSKKGITAVTELRGKTVALSGPGTTRDIFLHHTLKEQGLELGKDVKTLYVPGDPAALAVFISGNADAVLLAPPTSAPLVKDGYPVLVDYPKQGLNVIEPGMAVLRQFFQKNPNTLKAYLMGYLDGVKRAFDDPALAKQTEGKHSKITDQAVLDRDYQLGLTTWNKDMAINPADIQLVLDASANPKAKTAKPEEFYDNSLIQAVNRDYASKLFPGQVK